MARLWGIPGNFPESMIATYDKKTSPDRFGFYSTLPREQSEICARVLFHGNEELLDSLDALPNNALLPIVNDRFGQVIKSICGEDVQLLPLEVMCANGIMKTWWLVNILVTVCCIDAARSEVVNVPGGARIMGFKKLIHLEGCMAKHGIARERDYPMHVVISEALASSITTGNFRGLDILEPMEMCT